MDTGTVRRPSAPVEASGRRGPMSDPVLVAGVVVVAAAGMLLRSVNIVARPIGTDEPTIVRRALAVAQGDLVPPAFDYPPLPSYVAGAVLRVVAFFNPAVLGDDLAPYVVGRAVAIASSGVLIVLVGMLGAAVVRDRHTARVVGMGSAAAVSVSYLAVRLGSMSKPDVWQMVFAVACVLASVAYVRRRGMRWLVLAGGLAGLSAASKYAGVLAVVPLLTLLVLEERAGSDRVRRAVTTAGSAVAGFLVGTLATPITQRTVFIETFAAELAHQTSGHLGYEPTSSGWYFHAVTSLPGSWGPLMAAVGLGGAVWAVWRGDAALRLVGGAALLLYAVTGVSQVQFPHYILLPMPFLAVTGWAAALALGRAVGGRRAASIVGLVLALSLVPSALDSVRLVRAWDAPDTRVLAAEVGQTIGDPLHTEQYTGQQPHAANRTFAFGFTPEVVDCACVVAISSYQEERFRGRPDLYPEEIAVYDEIRARGDVLAEVGPDVHLSYRWDLLPQWGAGRLPVLGGTGPVGPTVTYIDLRP